MRMVAINKLLRISVWPRRRINVQRDQSIRLDDFVDQPSPFGDLAPDDGQVYGAIADGQRVTELRFERELRGRHFLCGSKRPIINKSLRIDRLVVLAEQRDLSTEPC